MITGALVNAVHDCSDGGVAIAVAEMALAGNLGAHLDPYGDVSDSSLTEFMFGEAQARFVATGQDEHRELLRDKVEAAGLTFSYIGSVKAQAEISIGDAPGYSGHFGTVSLADLRAAHEGFFPKLMGADAALA